MFGVSATLLFALGATGFGRWLIRPWTRAYDRAARWGIAGLVGLGAIGWLTFFLGLLPDGLRWGLYVVLAIALFGFVSLLPKLTPPTFVRREPLAWLAALALTLGAAISLVGVLVPSTALDWDTIAYQLAVPKIWLHEGRISFISYIHHSNFPMLVNDLYVWGLTWGDQAGAKAFSWVYGILGSLTLFGLARRAYGEKAAWWAPLCFSLSPMAIWLSGTGYVDVSHGLYAGIGVVLAARWFEDAARTNERNLAALMLAFGCASKYTGMQTVIALGVVLLVGGLLKPTEVRPALIRGTLAIGLLAFLGGVPWLARNVVNTGNPVYPFFYSKLGGKNWDAFSERIYREEQQTFGAGRTTTAEQTNYTLNPLQPSRIGHAILGLAYQPGRYVNPRPTDGSGLPFGALGFAGLLGGLAWAYSGRSRRFEGAILGTVLVSLLMWFFLSQQARYITTLMVPLSVLAAGAVARLSSGRLVAGAIALQAAVSLAITNLYLVSPPASNPERPTATPLQVALGQASPSEYLAHNLNFYEPAGQLNVVARAGKVALFDEVFGFYLEVPYFWANPGHTTELGYDQMRSGADLVAALRRLGVTHAYLNLTIYPSQDPTLLRWREAMGLDGPARPYTPEERAQMDGDLRTKWKALFADAVATGALQMGTPVGPRRLVFRIPE